MSLAFHVETGASRLVAALVIGAHALAIAGIAGAALASVSERSAPASVAIALLAALAGAAISMHARRALRAAARGTLVVDDQGAGAWCSGGAPSRPIRVERFWCGERIAWLRISDAATSAASERARGSDAEARRPARRIDLMLGRDRASEPTWRAMRAWLVWLERGPRH